MPFDKLAGVVGAMTAAQVEQQWAAGPLAKLANKSGFTLLAAPTDEARSCLSSTAHRRTTPRHHTKACGMPNPLRSFRLDSLLPACLRPQADDSRPSDAPAAAARRSGGNGFGLAQRTRRDEADSPRAPRSVRTTLAALVVCGSQPGVGREPATPATASSEPFLRRVLPKGGLAVSSASKSTGDPRDNPTWPPRSTASELLFSSLMRDVQADARKLASAVGGGFTAADGAETLRKAILQGTIGAKLEDQDRARLAYAFYGCRQAELGRQKLEAELALSPEFKKLPPAEAWRMLMDVPKWGDGRHGGLRFENEPGYMGAMYGGLADMLRSHRQGETLDAGLLERLHDAATNKVFDRNVYSNATTRSAQMHTGPDIGTDVLRRAQDRGHSLASGYKDEEVVRFDLKVGNYLSPGGLKELFAHQESLPDEHRCKLFALDTSSAEGIRPLRTAEDWDGAATIRLIARPLSSESSARLAQSLFDTCRSQLGEAGSDGAKLAAIAECVQRLEQAHLFTDGNARTTGYLVLNKLLLESGLAPAMIADPNRFDGLSNAELVRDIREGQQRFLQHCASPSA